MLEFWFFNLHFWLRILIKLLVILWFKSRPQIYSLHVALMLFNQADKISLSNPAVHKSMDQDKLYRLCFSVESMTPFCHSPGLQLSAVVPGPFLLVQSQPNPVGQFSILRQKILEDSTSVFIHVMHRLNHTSGQGRKYCHIYLNLLLHNNSQRSPSSGAVLLALIPAQPVGGQEKTGSAKFQPTSRTLHALAA